MPTSLKKGKSAVIVISCSGYITLRETALMTGLINEKLFHMLQNLNQHPAPISLSAFFFCTSVNKEAICQCFVNLLLSLSTYV